MNQNSPVSPILKSPLFPLTPKSDYFLSSFCDFDQLRRSKVADFRCSYETRDRVLSDAAIKSTTLLRRTGSNRQNEVQKMVKIDKMMISPSLFVDEG